jgi:pantoate--beta-alanine ligase
MLEIEQKYTRADFPAIERRLAEWGAAAPQEHEEADHYFNAPDRDFARTDEAFRLRRIGQANYLTYKGPKRAAAVKVRTELEIPLPPGEQAAEQFGALLVHLGYRPVAVVRKKRRSYHLRRGDFALTVCLDDVAGLGHYAEVEVLAPDEQAAAAQAALTETANALGLSEVERRSYLGLFLAARAPRSGQEPAQGSNLNHQGVEGRVPKVVRTVAELRSALAEARRGGRSVGLVPTMGALHEGHLSVIRACRGRNEVVVVSVFVNPTQFGPSEDLKRYPRPFEQDLALCAAAGVDLVFHPEPEVMYPPGFRTFVEVTGLQDVLEGASRPGHFRGVCTVVLKLFNLIQPNRAYFGQKDGQQARIIQQMVADLNVPVEVVVEPTVREPDGLALSSRNRYLDAEQRRQATVLSRALNEARARALAGERDAGVLRKVLAETVASAPGAVLDYAAVVDADSLRPVVRLTGATLLALAVKFGNTRLIDNLLLRVGES